MITQKQINSINPFRDVDTSIGELASLLEFGYIQDGRDIDDDLLDEVINSRDN